MMSPPLLSVKQLSIAFAKQHAWHAVVDQVSFELRAGECVALVGESGSGKSLTGLAILQLLPLAARVVRDSQICFNGVNLLGKSEQAMQQVRGVKIGMIFQDALAAFNPVLTIGAQLQEVLAHVAASAQVRYERALACLARVGLQDPVRCYHAYPHQLSGGMRQRAMIAMALAGEPQLIIADEPTTALDVALQAQIIALLQELKQRDGLALLFITHDLAVAAHIADRVVVMQSGKVVEQADATTFFKTPTTAYAKRLLSCVTQQAAPLSPVADAVPELSVQDLTVTFRASRQWWWQPAPRVTAVDGVSLTIWAGQTHALVGESGSGKSTLARSVARLLKPTSGRICFEQQDEWRMHGKRLHQLHKDIQMIFQDPYTSLNPRRVIFESVSEGLKEHRLVTTQVEMLQRVDFWLTKVGLPVECKWRYPHEFSGGERQRLCIARALAVQPKVLILDEPTSALDVSMQAQILTLLSELQQELGVGYLLITHDLAVVRRMAHYVSVMHQGRVVETGAAASVLLTPQQAYTQRLVALMPSQIFNA